MEKAEKERKQKLSFRFALTRLVIEISKTIAKKFKKFLSGFISSQNRIEKAKKERKQKLSLRFVLTRTVIENSKKIEKN